MKWLRILLILVAVVSIGVAVSYPIRYKVELDTVSEELESLADIRKRAMREADIETVTQVPVASAAPLPTQPPLTEAPPELTEAPEVTEIPETTQNPEDTEIPENTESPEATAVPETTEAPEATEIPEASEVPEDTAAPEMTQASAQTQAPAETGAAPTGTAAPPSGSAAPAEAANTDTPAPSDSPTPTPGIMDLIINDPDIPTPTPVPTFTPKPTPSPTPSPTPNRKLRDDADTYRDKEKVKLDEDKILPELKEIYALNHDLVGWLYIDGTNIDYPVVQHWNREYYLRRDFYGKDNANGQIILDTGCDPYTPSYNLVISGHHMNSGAMFGKLQQYKDAEFWRAHKVVEFDTLMERKRYVVFAAFYSADYDENEEGFRYSVNIQYKRDADEWLKEIHAYQIYYTGIEAEFGDEFITLTTCDHSRRDDGRFVVVARRIREGETIV